MIKMDCRDLWLVQPSKIYANLYKSECEISLLLYVLRSTWYQMADYHDIMEELFD